MRRNTVHSLAMYIKNTIILRDEIVEFLGGVLNHTDLIFVIDEVSRTR